MHNASNAGSLHGKMKKHMTRNKVINQHSRGIFFSQESSWRYRTDSEWEPKNQLQMEHFIHLVNLCVCSEQAILSPNQINSLPDDGSNFWMWQTNHFQCHHNIQFDCHRLWDNLSKIALKAIKGSTTNNTPNHLIHFSIMVPHLPHYLDIKILLRQETKNTYNPRNRNYHDKNTSSIRLQEFKQTHHIDDKTIWYQHCTNLDNQIDIIREKEFPSKTILTVTKQKEQIQ